MATFIDRMMRSEGLGGTSLFPLDRGPGYPYFCQKLVDASKQLAKRHIFEHSLIETVHFSSRKKIRYRRYRGYRIFPYAEYITYLEHRAIINIDAGGGVQHTLVFDGLCTLKKYVYVGTRTESDILVGTWSMEIDRTISHSWSSNPQQPEPFVKLLFEGCVKEIKVAFPGHRYDVFSEKFTPFVPKPPPGFTKIFRNTLSSLFQSNPENVRMHSDKKESPSQDGDGDETRSTADDSNPKDPEDRDRAHSDGSDEGQDSSGQDSPAQDGDKVRISTDDQNFQLDPEISITDIFMNAYETVYGSSPENVQGHKDSSAQDGGTTDYPNPKDPEDRDRAHSDENLKAQNSSPQP